MENRASGNRVIRGLGVTSPCHISCHLMSHLTDALVDFLTIILTIFLTIILDDCCQTTFLYLNA